MSGSLSREEQLRRLDQILALRDVLERLIEWDALQGHNSARVWRDARELYGATEWLSMRALGEAGGAL